MQKNQQGDIRGYRPQPTGPVPTVPPAPPMAQPTPYTPQGMQPGYPQPSSLQPENPMPPIPGYQTAPYPPQQPTQPIQAVPPAQPLQMLLRSLDWNVMMLLAAGLIGLIYALVVSITFGQFTRLIPHLVVIWLSVTATGAACLMRHRLLALGAAAGYVVGMLLFLNYFYWLIAPAALCAAAGIRMRR